MESLVAKCIVQLAACTKQSMEHPNETYSDSAQQYNGVRTTVTLVAEYTLIYSIR